MDKRFSILYVALTLFSIVFGTYFFLFSLDHPYVGALVKQVEGKHVVSETEPNTWSKKNLSEGDILIEVDGMSPSDFETISKWNMLEQVSEIIVEKRETHQIQSYTVTADLDVQMVFQTIIPLLVFIFSLYSSYLIWKNRSESTKKSSIYLVLFLLNISLSYIVAGASARGEPLARSVITSLFLLIPVFYLHFLYHYFKELNSLWFTKKLITIVYILVCFNLLINVLSWVSLIPTFQVEATHAKAINLGSFLVLFIITLSTIFIGHRRAKFKAQKYWLNILIYTNITAFAPFLFFYVFPYSIFQVQLISPVILSSFILVIPVSLTYQYFMKKVFDVDFIIGRLRYYTFLSIVPSLVGIFVFLFTRTDNSSIFTIRGFVVNMGVVLLAFYLREITDEKLKLSKFYKKYNYQESVLEFTEKLRKANLFSEVVTELKLTISNALDVDNVYMLELDLGKEGIRSHLEAKQALLETHKENILEAIKKVGNLVEIRNGFILNIGESQNKGFIILALSNFDTPKLSKDDITWLKTLAYYTNVTIENFIKIEGFMEKLKESSGEESIWLNRFLYQLEEKHRSVLAKDLHDSVIQDLLSIKQKIEINDYIVDDPVKSSFCKSLILDDLAKVVAITRETCQDLRPNVLYDLGIEKAIEKLVEQHISQNHYNIRFTTNNIKNDIDFELQIHLYRIAQELLNNTNKHSNAKNIVLMLVKIKDKLVLHYEDDGIGADMNTIFNKTDSMGLSGMKERVKSLNGTMNVLTENEQGFKVSVEI